MGLIFAIITINKVNYLNTVNFMPKDVRYIDEYEQSRLKIKQAGRLAKIALIVFLISTVLQIVIATILRLNGIDIYTLIGY